MQVEVRVLSPVIRAAGGLLDVSEDATGMDVLEAMGAKSADGVIMIVNGRRQDLGTSIAEGDKIHFLSPVAGG